MPGRARILAVDATGSTNADMMTLALAGEPEGTWLRAERQEAGRGRQGRAWDSPPGNLYASTLVRARETDPQPATLAMVAAVALDQVLGHWLGDRRAMIKWPNDLLVDGAKIAGILLERRGDEVVVGFGVNLVSHPEGLGRPVTSVAALIGTPPDTGAFAADLCEAFGYWLGRWRSGGRLNPVRTRWLERAHALGSALSARLDATTSIEGLFDGIDEAGSLRLRLADGTARVIHAGDVFLA